MSYTLMYSTSRWIHCIATGNGNLELMQVATYITQNGKKTHNIFSISLILNFFSKNLSLSLIKFKLTERTPFWFQFLCLQLLKFSPLFLDSQMCLLHLLRFFFPIFLAHIDPFLDNLPTFAIWKFGYPQRLRSHANF